MANKMKYSEEQLCEAVRRYAEEHRGKVKASELAMWARDNMAMEEVQGYHFLRPKIVKIDGIQKEEKRECAEMIEEINKNRKLLFSSQKNVILNASSIDEFFFLPISEQRKAIVAVRESIKEMTKNNLRLQVENDVVKRENKAVEKRMEQLAEKMKEMAKEITQTMRLCRYVTNQLADRRCSEICREMGIEDGNIDLQRFEESVHNFDEVALNFRDMVKRYSIETSVETTESLLEEVLSEISEYVHEGKEK